MFEGCGDGDGDNHTRLRGGLLLQELNYVHDWLGERDDVPKYAAFYTRMLCSGEGVKTKEKPRKTVGAGLTVCGIITVRCPFPSFSVPL